MKQIKIFDTTLRDGEQSPGCSMNLKEKIQIAKQLELLKVDVIEAGFAVVSPGDFTSVKTIAEEVKYSTVASLARALPKDIDCAWDAIKNAKYPRIHTFLATSDIHMEYKLKKSREEVLEQTRLMVGYAKKLCNDIEFSAEDASRSDREFLVKVLQEAVNAGATVLNIPDTVGYAAPDEMADLIKYVKENVRNIEKVAISVHCHNDLGLGVANTLAAILAGADQVECTINGIGERAGNASLEEIVMNLRTKRNFYNADCNVDATQLYRASKLLTMVTGVKVQPNKAIVGENAFAHEAGIHQHGMMANRMTYEIMTPESIGLSENKMILGKHSGRHAFEDRLSVMGYNIEADKLNNLFEKFKVVADKKKTVSDKDLEALVREIVFNIPDYFTLDKYVINSSNVLNNTCNIRICKDGNEYLESVATGDGPIDAAFNAINIATSLNVKLEEYNIEAVTGGTDAQGAVSVRISSEDKNYKGYGVSLNIFEASILAYINALNNMYFQENKGGY